MRALSTSTRPELSASTPPAAGSFATAPPARITRAGRRTAAPRPCVVPAARRWFRALGATILLLGCGVATAIAPIAPFAPPAAHAAAAAPAFDRGGMVVSSSADAARAGAAILREGGNAVDAAVATAFALAVTQPFSAGLGGGAFVLIRTANGEVIAVDARESAPAAATREMYLQPGVPEKASVIGPLAVAVPGFVIGMEMVLARWGTLPLERVIAPAIVLAEQGFRLAPDHADRINFMRARLPAEAFPETHRIQFAPAREHQGVAEPGQRLVQADLAKSLRAIAKQGSSVIHGGPIGQAMVAEVQKRGGLLTLDDLADYKPKLRKPVSGSYRGVAVHSFPPPSSGGAVLIETLNILEGFDLAGSDPRSSQTLHLVSEAMKLAFADRAVYMGDADFVEVPIERLVSKAYGKQQAARIDPAKATAVKVPGRSADDAGTAHLSTSDAEGAVVALTMTINTLYGSGITVPGTGILLNNEMDDFAIAPDTPNAYGLVDVRGANAIAPGKRPLSSMTPTILERDGRAFMVTGSPGGPRIISTTLLTILGVIDFGMDVQAAVSEPRFHHQWIPDEISVEPEIAPDLVRALEARGHTVVVSPRHWSAAEAIVIDPATGFHMGGTDPRTSGARSGPAAALAQGRISAIT